MKLIDNLIFNSSNFSKKLQLLLKYGPELHEIFAYDSRLTLKEINYFVTHNISPDVVNQYFFEKDRNFLLVYLSGRAIKWLLKKNIQPNEIQHFKNRLNLFQYAPTNTLYSIMNTPIRDIFDLKEGVIKYLIGRKINLCIMNDYLNIKFNNNHTNHIIYFIENKVPVDFIKSFSKHFYLKDIKNFHVNDIPSKYANKFTKKFHSEFIIDCFERNINPKYVNNFKARFRPYQIAEFLDNGIDPEYANSFKRYINHYKIIKHSKGKTENNFFGKYRLKGTEARILSKHKIPPGYANSFNESWKAQEIVKAYDKSGLKDFSRFSKRYSNEDIYSFLRNNINYQSANKYAELFGEKHWADFLQFNSFSADNFDGETIYKYFAQGYVPPNAAKYDRRFSILGIILFAKNNITYSIANNYPKDFNEKQILSLYNFGLTADHIKDYKNITEQVFTELLIYGDINIDNYILVGIGGESIVMRNRASQKLLKYILIYNSNEISNYLLLEQNCPNSKRFLKITSVIRDIAPMAPQIFEMEFFKGNSLEKIIKQKTFSSNEVIIICFKLIEGLIELRKAGLYHKDLHLGNILVDENYDLKIIDLGVSSPDPFKSHSLNRGFGGNNDLFSVAQIIYFLSCKKLLFGDIQSNDKDKIRLERNKYKKLDKKFIDSKLFGIRNDSLRDILRVLLSRNIWIQSEYNELYQLYKTFKLKIDFSNNIKS